MSRGIPPWAGWWLPLLVAYSVPFVWIAEHWLRTGSDYGHGPLVVLVAAVVIWTRRDQLRSIPRRPDRRGWWLLGPGLACHLAGALLLVDSLSAVSLVFTVPGAVWVQQGAGRARAIWPVLLLPALALPMPFHLLQEVTFQLKEFASTSALWLANVLGVEAVRVGANVQIPGQERPLEVADACSGLRSLLALTTVGYCVAFFMGPQQGPRRWVLVAMAVPLALLSNVLRITGMFLVADGLGVDVLEQTAHDWLNVAEWVFALAVLLGADALLVRWFGSSGGEPTASPAPAAIPPDPAPPGTAGSAIALAVLAGILLTLGLVRPEGGAIDRAARLPAALAGWEAVREEPLTEQQKQLLGTRDAVRRLYWNGAAALWVTAVFHDSNWKSVHPPQLCLEGSNMTLRSRGERLLDVGPAGLLVMNRNGATGELGDSRTYVSLYAYGAGEMVTHAYSSFVWHHAPRALFRAPTSGFLLRVEGAPEPGQTEGWIEDQAAELLQALVPAAQKLLGGEGS